ncbi:unnamed protein product [Moneuplotes crassus]|uniref:Glutamine-dependent NAD(+) synthetase n=1 Tax=Euplotes crassus TaxID=5936 RepID=A0AAD1Y9I2_EUPCR|nr:unnamed protein product [Moneuplotes crassus]
MDFEHNKANIIDSIKQAEEAGATIRFGSELEIPGYGCEDYFLEMDTINHSWEVLAEIIEEGWTDNIICDIGVPVYHKSFLYNCRAIVYKRRIHLLRPKTSLNNERGKYENRYFTEWTDLEELVDFDLPEEIKAVTNQEQVKLGVAILNFLDCKMIHEVGTEFQDNQRLANFMKKNSYQKNLDGEEDRINIVLNSTCTFHSLGRLQDKIDKILEHSSSFGAAYVVSNQIGCDGSQLICDGGSMIVSNGKVIAKGSHFNLKTCEGVISPIDLDEISNSQKSTEHNVLNDRDLFINKVEIPLYVCKSSSRGVPFYENINRTLSLPEEISLSCAHWLWNFLIRSEAKGFLLPLSGGLDSACVCTICFSLCRLIFQDISDDENSPTLNSLRRVIRDDSFVPTSPQEICEEILSCYYLGTENSSSRTYQRAFELSQEIGCKFDKCKIDGLYDSSLGIFTDLFQRHPRYLCQGGTEEEDLALQNIQARVRKIFASFIAESNSFDRNDEGYLQILSTTNVDEALTGNITKYDNSSGTLNPIGGLNKDDLRKFLEYAKEEFGLDSLQSILDANPTPELRPSDDIEKDSTQIDEQDLGLTYSQLNVLGRLRTVERCGPVSMFSKLTEVWFDLSPSEIAQKVKIFFTLYSKNRHKAFSLAPSLCISQYEVDIKYDYRQSLYNDEWSFQFKRIDQMVDELDKEDLV